jgi:hypothetical protein
MNRLHLIQVLIAVIVLYSCKPPAKENDPLPDLQEKGIYVVNQGNFQAGNGSVSFYNYSTDVTTSDLFSLENNRPAGDVCQSLYFYNNSFYLVVNNSGKIEVMNPSFVSTFTIQNLTSPRYIAFGSNTKGYVSDLYANGVSVFNTLTNVIEKKIRINYWTEELITYKDTIYVTSPTSNYLYLINTTTDMLIDSINIGYGSSAIALDTNKNLWILTSGDSLMNIKPSVIAINPANRQVIFTQQFANVSANQSDLNYNPADGYVYWIDGDVKRLNTQNTSIPAQVFISASGRNLYGLGIDMENGYVIVSDAGDYVRRSIIYVYSKNGNLVTSFTAGVISGYMLVK